MPVIPRIKLRNECTSNIAAAISNIQLLSFNLIKWFENSYHEANPGKSHIFLSTRQTEKVIIREGVLTSSVKNTWYYSRSELILEKYIKLFVIKPLKNTFSV